jgi:CRISPR-associated protein Cmr2
MGDVVMPDSDSALLAFSIGPVQDYISAARRTQDLYVGSALLSQLMLEAYNVITAAGGEVLFPIPPNVSGSQRVSLPNRLIASFSSMDAAQKGADLATQAATKRWSNVSNSVHAWLGRQVANSGPAPPGWDRDWDAQVARYLEITWAVVSPESGKDYMTQLSRVQATLEARKRLQDFAADSEYGYKCTIFPGLAAMGPGHGDPHGVQSYRAVREFWTGLAERVRTGEMAIALRPNGSERLSALACVKRFAGRIEENNLRLNVPSTSSIAAATYKAAMLNQLTANDTHLVGLLRAYHAALQAIKDDKGNRIPMFSPYLAASAKPYLARIAAQVPDAGAAETVLGYDGDLFYEETLTANRLYDDYGLRLTDGVGGASGGKLVRAELDAARTALRALTDYTLLLKLDPPARYYAILQMDGDHLGGLLKRITNPDAHMALSRALSGFAHTTVRRIVEIDHPGLLIYAGGDDLLALLPLVDALPAADALQAAYHTEVSAALQASYKETNPQEGDEVQRQLTASIGIALAHQQAALDQALTAARQAEQAAKREYGRNAVVVRAMKRSGAPVQVGIRHPAADQSTGLGPVEALVLLMRWGALSPRLAAFWTREAGAFADDLPEMLQAEISRLLLRQTDKDTLYDAWQGRQATRNSPPSRATPEDAQRLCAYLAREYKVINDYLAQESKEAERKDYLHNTVCTALAARLTTLAQPPRGEADDSPCGDAGPAGPARGAAELAGWLQVAAFLTRGGAE